MRGGGGRWQVAEGPSRAAGGVLQAPTPGRRDGAGSPIHTRPFLELAFIASWLLALLFSCVPICQRLGSLGLSADIFKSTHRPCGWSVALALGVGFRLAESRVAAVVWGGGGKGRWAGHRLASRDKAVR